MALVLNPSLAAQNGLAMIAALSCVEFIREIPLYSAGDTPSKKSITIKFIIALIIVLIVMFIMITYARADAHVQPLLSGSATAQS
jgi:hypothetical protein